VKGRATAYSGTAQSGFKMDMPFTNMIGNGGLLTTVGDLLKWNENLQNPTVGGAAYVDSMQTRARLRNGRTISYALGIEVDAYNGVREVSHGGSTAGYRTFLARYPEQRVSVAVLCNLASANAGGLAHQVADVFLPKQVAAAQSGSGAGVTLSQSQLERWAGRYVDPGTDRSLNLVVRDGALVNEQARVPSVALAPDRFRVVSGNEFVFAGPPGRRTMKMITPTGDTTLLVEKAPFPSTLPLNAYVGTYSSDELDVQLEVALKDGKLVLRRRPADELAMRPTYADDFDTDAGSLRFTRDKSGKVSGFSIYAGRVLDVRFHRAR
jgi:CubicO group peptidase (beta-lactamase class C family)